MNFFETVMLPYDTCLEISATHCYETLVSVVKKKWFLQPKEDLVNWPNQSLDLNPIETFWLDLKRSVSNGAFPSYRNFI